jgi:heat shock protein HtpX
MFESLRCYFECLWINNAAPLIIILLVILVTAVVVSFYSLKPGHVFLAQSMTSAIIVVGFLGMSCPMFSLIWVYLAFIIIGGLSLLLLYMAFKWRLNSLSVPPEIGAKMLEELSGKYNCEIRLLDLQKSQAFTYRNTIYISIGLVELLEHHELEAVVAHEKYHVYHTPNRFLAGLFAVSSLWFYSLRDEKAADQYASDLVGKKAVVSALSKLGVRGFQKRIAAMR